MLTTDPAWCSYYRENSANVKDRFECVNADIQKTPHKKIPINELNCTSAGGTWTRSKAWDEAAPECRSHQHSRQNHLGNVATSQDGFLTNLPETAHFDWYAFSLCLSLTHTHIHIHTGQFQKFRERNKTSQHACSEFDTIFQQTITVTMRRGALTWDSTITKKKVRSMLEIIAKTI